METEEPFGPEELRKALEKLPSLGQLAFLLSCVERLFPNYLAFNRRHAWGHPSALQEALALGWRSLGGGDVPRSMILDALERCEEALPNTEQFNSELVSPGLDAAACSCLLLEFLLESNSQKAIEAATLARDTVDMYVQDVEPFRSNDPALERQILTHTFMKRELERQRHDLRTLMQVDWNRPEVISELAQRWKDTQVSNIGQPRM